MPELRLCAVSNMSGLQPFSVGVLLLEVNLCEVMSECWSSVSHFLLVFLGDGVFPLRFEVMGLSRIHLCATHLFDGVQFRVTILLEISVIRRLSRNGSHLR